MTSQLTELMNENRNEKHKYKTTSLNPVNPENNPNEFEKEALHFFQKIQTTITISKLMKNQIFLILWENSL